MHLNYVVAAVSRLKLKHDTSTPYRSTANPIAERSVRTVTEGTRTLLEQSGFPIQWWPYASRCFCHSMHMAVVDGDSACNKGHGVAFDGLSIPYGCLADFRPTNIGRIEESREVRNGFYARYLHWVHTTRWWKVGSRLSTSFVHWKISELRTQLIPFDRIFRIREVIPDCSGVDSFSTGYTFPLRAVTDNLTRTLSPHGNSTEISFPRRGSMGKKHLSNKILKRTTYCNQASAWFTRNWRLWFRSSPSSSWHHTSYSFWYSNLEKINYGQCS